MAIVDVEIPSGYRYIQHRENKAIERVDVRGSNAVFYINGVWKSIQKVISRTLPTCIVHHSYTQFWYCNVLDRGPHYNCDTVWRGVCSWGSSAATSDCVWLLRTRWITWLFPYIIGVIVLMLFPWNRSNCDQVLSPSLQWNNRRNWPWINQRW